mmetsp:Transcript_20358/g.38717  ORF Transcript_20358/g.38717 Transcript_20358/m.38717 type:complete len:211 (+) Transcript_20358:24-656(+)
MSCKRVRIGVLTQCLMYLYSTLIYYAAAARRSFKISATEKRKLSLVFVLSSLMDTRPLFSKTAAFRASPPSSFTLFESTSRLAKLSFTLMPSANATAPRVPAPLQLRITSTREVLLARVSPMCVSPSSPRPFQPRFTTSTRELALRPSAINAAPLARILFHPRFSSLNLVPVCSKLPKASPPFSQILLWLISNNVTLLFSPRAAASVMAS